jgi:hypothetical protein
MKIVKHKIAILFILGLLTGGCGGENSSSSDITGQSTEDLNPTPPASKPQLLAKLELDLANVTALSVASGSELNSASSMSIIREQITDSSANAEPISGPTASDRQADENYLASIPKSGGLVPVAMSSDRSSPPLRSAIETKKFIFLELKYPIVSNSLSCWILAIHKSTLKISCLPNLYLPVHGFAGGMEKTFQDDATGNIIFFAAFRDWEGGTTHLFSIRANDQGDITLKEVLSSADMGYVEEIAVNDLGDALIRGESPSNATNTTGRILRYMTAAGGIQPAGSGDYSTCLTNGPGKLKSSFFYVDINLGSVSQVSSANNVVSTTNYFTPPTRNAVFSFEQCQSRFSTDASVFASFQRRFDSDATSAGYFVELVRDAANFKPTKILIKNQSYKQVHQMVGNNDNIFMLAADQLGNTGIVQYSIKTQVQSDILDSTQYLISKIEWNNGSILFSAKRKSDGVRCLVKLDPLTRQMTILAERKNEGMPILRLN